MTPGDQREDDLKRLRNQAEEVRDMAQAHDRRIRSAMETLAEGWHGDKARSVMQSIDVAHQETMSQYRRLASSLDERADEAKKAMGPDRESETKGKTDGAHME